MDSEMKDPNSEVHRFKIFCQDTVLVEIVSADEFKKSIKSQDLEAVYSERHKNDDLLFKKEYQLLPRSQKDKTTTASDCAENRHKLRFKDIKAYDQTRVKLTPVLGTPGSDFINANFVPGYKNKTTYICAQGPLEKTVDDFWRMIWEYRIKVIVMLTNLVESGKNKCAQYWPEDDTSKRKHKYGQISLGVVKEYENAKNGDYVIRRFVVTGPAHSIKAKDTGPLSVTQFQFVAWGDHKAPDQPQGILKLIDIVRKEHKHDKSSPMLVHCSAGVGRTGTFVALDCLMHQLKKSGHVEVFNAVDYLRKHRNILVQTPEQYIFLFRALLEYARLLQIQHFIKKSKFNILRV